MAGSNDITPEERAQIMAEIREHAALRAQLEPHEREATALLVLVGLPRGQAEEAVGYALSDSIERVSDLDATDESRGDRMDASTLALHALWWSDGVERGNLEDGDAGRDALEAHDAAAATRMARLRAAASALRSIPGAGAT